MLCTQYATLQTFQSSVFGQGIKKERALPGHLIYTLYTGIILIWEAVKAWDWDYITPLLTEGIHVQCDDRCPYSGYGILSYLLSTGTL